MQHGIRRHFRSSGSRVSAQPGHQGRVVVVQQDPLLGPSQVIHAGNAEVLLGDPFRGHRKLVSLQPAHGLLEAPVDRPFKVRYRPGEGISKMHWLRSRCGAGRTPHAVAVSSGQPGLQGGELNARRFRRAGHMTVGKRIIVKNDNPEPHRFRATVMKTLFCRVRRGDCEIGTSKIVDRTVAVGIAGAAGASLPAGRARSVVSGRLLSCAFPDCLAKWAVAKPHPLPGRLSAASDPGNEPEPFTR